MAMSLLACRHALRGAGFEVALAADDVAAQALLLRLVAAG
jgi:hypothetical protein